MEGSRKGGREAGREAGRKGGRDRDRGRKAMGETSTDQTLVEYSKESKIVVVKHNTCLPQHLSSEVGSQGIRLLVGGHDGEGHMTIHAHTRVHARNRMHTRTCTHTLTRTETH